MAKPRRKRAGRPRKAGPREPNGRHVRSYVIAEQEKDAMATALEARQRVFGLTEAQAKDGRATSVIGRMAMQGQISADQLDAARRYIEVTSAYQRAIGIRPTHDEPRPEVHGDGSEDYAGWCDRKKRDYAGMMGAIEEVCVESRTQLPKKALDMIVLRDIAAPMLDGELRTVLNRLHRHFFQGGARKAA